jgi:hypothetical protein
LTKPGGQFCYKIGAVHAGFSVLEAV